MGNICTSARAGADPFKHIYSLPLVHRPKDVLLVVSISLSAYMLLPVQYARPYRIFAVLTTKPPIVDAARCGCVVCGATYITCLPIHLFMRFSCCFVFF